MIKRCIFTGLLFLWAGIVSAQGIKLKGNKDSPVTASDIRGQVGEFVYVTAFSDAKYKVKWMVLDSGLKMIPVEFLKNDNVGIFVASKEGIFRIIAWHEETREIPATAVVTIGTAPVPIDPPKPIDPTPVDPKPKPVDPPKPEVKLTGMRVLIVYETNDVFKYSKGQQQVIASVKVRQYLEDKCAKRSDDGKGDYNFFDQNVPVGNLPKLWKDTLARSRASVPWVVVFGDNGVIGFEGPLPADTNPDAFITFLKKWGG